MTRTQKQILNTVLTRTVRRWSRVAAVKFGRRATDTTYEFFWATEFLGRPGKPLSERVIDACKREGWLESVRPEGDPPPQSFHEMMEAQTRLTLRITEAGREALGVAKEGSPA